MAGDGYAVEAYAFEVSDALLTFRDTPGVPLPMRADLDQLSWEVAAFGANAATGWLEPKEWVSLSSKITRVTQGESPTEGPRYQSEFPPEVIEAVGVIDGALDAGDVEAAGDAMWTLNGAFWSWLDVAPPQVSQNAYEVAEQIDVLAYSMDSLSLQSIRSQWGEIRERLRI